MELNISAAMEATLTELGFELAKTREGEFEGYAHKTFYFKRPAVGLCEGLTEGVDITVYSYKEEVNALVFDYTRGKACREWHKLTDKKFAYLMNKAFA